MTLELERGRYLEEMEGLMVTGEVGLVAECGKQ